MKNRAIILSVFACILMLASVCEACPTCKQGIAEGGDHARVIEGYFWSILFMMSMPFLILTSLCSYFYLIVRKARAMQPVGFGMAGQQS